MSDVPSISVITATWNAKEYLPRLIESLQNQTDNNFEWIVADGESNDGTLSLLNEAKDLNVRVYSQPDFGVYDALNRAVLHTSSEYYLVVGADDYLAPDAIENYRNAVVVGDKPDLIAAAVQVGQIIFKPRSGMGWLYGMVGVSSSHSVGLMIKRKLHDKFGLYSRKFPIAADQLFIKTVLNQQASIIRCKFIAGEFGIKGASGGDNWGMITELFRVQVETERWVLLQVIILFLRCTKCYIKGLLRN